MARKAFDVMHDIRATQHQIDELRVYESELKAEIHEITGMSFEQFERGMRQLLGGALDVSIVRLDPNDRVIERVPVDLDNVVALHPGGDAA